ncbi:transcriptional regulator [Actinomadura roseirufa]|uniref:transcriptional regulator n=1 Tax=Actinomadura roseirufa TaxID=2094049 RepID=UPI001041B24D|nr:transcriptional regulator [Actinomadura roseirufa]
MSTADKKAIGARLRRLREEPRDRHGRAHRSREKWALMLRAAAGPDADGLPTVRSLADMIKQWERGDYIPGPIYRPLYARVTGLSELDLFGDDGETTVAEPLPAGDPPGRLAAVTGRRVGSGIVADLAARVHALRLADDVLAGRDLLVPAFRELDAAVRIYRESTHGEETGRALLSVIGEFAQIAGWVAGDAGLHRRAAETYRLGIDAAREAENGSLVCNLIGSLAYQTTNVEDSRHGVQLGREALEAAGPDAPPRMRALAWDRIAWAMARAHDAQEAMRSLGEASTALAEDGGGDANEPEQAAAAASRMLKLSADVASDRTDQRAAVVLERLKQYQDVPQVRELLERLDGEHCPEPT